MPETRAAPFTPRGTPSRAHRHPFSLLRSALPMAIAGLCAIALAASLATAQEPPPVAPPPAADISPSLFGTGFPEGEAQELLLALKLRNLELAPDIPAVLDGNLLLVPLGELAEALEFRIGVSPAAGRASGWFLRENRLFSLDLRRALVVVEGREASFDPRLARVLDNDLYIDIRLLAQWLPVDLQLDIASLTLTVLPREALPLEERLAREAYRRRVLVRRDPGPALATLDHPYRAWGIPTADISTETTMTRRHQASRLTSRYSILATGDLAWMNTEIYASGDEKKPLSDARIRMERKDPDGTLLGPLNATEVAFGDITTGQVPLVSNQQLARGAVLSNMPLTMPEEFDRITLEGDLPLGWEVELYRNNVLLDFKTASDDGRYRFADIPLLFGVNLMRLIFYGPQGQRREELRQIRVGPDQLNPGDVHYRISMAQHDERVIEGLRSGTRPAQRGRERATGTFMIGVADWLTLGANAATLPLSDGQRDYLGLTAIAATGPILWRSDAIRNSDQGSAGRIMAQTSVYGFSLLAEENRFDRFRSEAISGSGTEFLNARTRLRAEGAVPLGGAGQIPLSLTLDRDRFSTDRRDLRLTNRLSYVIRRVSLSNTLRWTRSQTGTSRDTQTSGTFLAGGAIEATRIRSQANYSLGPRRALDAASVTLERPLWEATQGRVTWQRKFTGTRGDVYSAGLNIRHRHAFVGIRAEYDETRREAQAVLSLSFSLGPDPARGSAWIAGERAATSGNFVGRVFRDQDGDGVFNPEAGDQPIPGARLAVEGRPRGDEADEDGLILLRGLPAYQRTAIGIDPRSLGDPFLMAREPGIGLVPRPGTAPIYDFAVATTGEIDGTVFRIDGDAASPVSGAIIQLVDDHGMVLREARSAFDGFYLFDFVPPGRYSLRIDPDQLSSLRLRLEREEAVEIEGDGSILSDQNLLLIALPRP